MAKHYTGSIADFEKKLDRIMERLGVTDFKYDYTDTRSMRSCWVEMIYKGRAYRFENSNGKSKASGRDLNYISDLLWSIAYSLEGLARAIEQGIFTLDMLLAGVPALPEAASLEPCFQAMGFSKRPETVEEVKAQYRRMSKVVHPDNGGTTDSFIALMQNYEQCLSLIEGK